ncbi:hypothetical protein RHMOL_Rhmol08G0314200 [Rhododendron molle]|uniref:Uncharacterized protein n=1 Tax=Rhododendron molle TaxID=49168 RepID=A0ACC0MWK4_RHOML|nr:hypothetical protein RHMOL_Rhmol08G0314200 [Rhododendron molle]
MENQQSENSTREVEDDDVEKDKDHIEEEADTHVENSVDDNHIEEVAETARTNINDKDTHVNNSWMRGCNFKIGLSQVQLAIPRDVAPVNSLESISPITRAVELVEDQQLALLDEPETQAIEEKRAKKHKTAVELLGIPKTKNSKKGGRRNKQKCVVFRAATTAAAFSVSSDDIRNNNRIIRLDAAQAVWTVTKIIGVDYMGMMKR